ncbi:MAG: hypothetical protein HKM93_09625 [Desulfobacteraceae bacterium]|nr:hypothetical protein [Desulfobacteraceae bacterium]
MIRQHELENDGWEKRSTYDEPRLTEMLNTYEALGYEVLLEPFDALAEPACNSCLKGTADRYKTIYTRMGKG